MKTIEEAAIEYAKIEYEDLYYNDSDEDSIDVDITIKDFKAGVEFAQRWIPVEEELPEKYTPVLAYDTYPTKCYVVKYDSVFGFMTNHFNQCVKVTHWRPIELK